MIKLLLPFVVDSANIRRLFGLRKYLGNYFFTCIKVFSKMVASKGNYF